MPVQEYEVCDVFPVGLLKTTPEKFAKLFFGDIGLPLTLSFEIGDKLITDEGVIIYRKGHSDYTLVGTSQESRPSERMNGEWLPVDLSELLDTIIDGDLGFVFLLH